MSNPAVFLLNSSMIRENKLMIEDNIGESIHFHIGLVRFDLTVKEFDDITLKLINVMNEQLNLKEFNLLEQNEYFLERIAPIIPYIVAVKDEKVDINTLKYRYETKDGKIQEAYIRDTPVYQFYSGNEKIICEYVFEREIWQSKKELMEQVKTKRNNVIYVDKDNFILDGYKSICAGIVFSDMEKVIDVKRLIISDEQEIKCILFREVKKW